MQREYKNITLQYSVMQSNPTALRLMLVCEVSELAFPFRGVLFVVIVRFAVIVMAVVCCVASGSI